MTTDTDIEDSMSGGVTFREIQSTDFQVIKELHEELFPVKYSDVFYENTCNGKGVGGGKLYSSLAVVSGQVVGFLLAQMVLYPSKCEDKDLFSHDKQPKYVCYILTLGLTKEYRRSGLGTALIRQCEEYASLNWDCGAVYLHVIHNNANAIRFYKKNNYMELRYLSDFYFINERYEAAYLYIRYTPGFKAPLTNRLWISASYLLDVGMTYVSNFLALLSPSLGAPTGTSALPAKSTAVTDPQVDLTGIDSVIRLDSNALVDDGVEQV